MAHGRGLAWQQADRRCAGKRARPPHLGRRTYRLPQGADVLSFQSVGFFSLGAGEVGVDITAAVVTVSDKGYAGQRQDLSGPELAARLRQMGARVLEQTIVPDEPDQIQAALVRLADSGDLDLIVTTGGTGAAPRDRTPEATLAVIDRPMPGLAELLRFEGYKKTPLAVLSRGVAGLRGKCLIVNLPGSPKAVREGMDILAAVLPHAVQMARGEQLEHGEAKDAH